MKRVYLDHNATSPLRPEARALLHELEEAGLGNPSSLHGRGRAARDAIDQARERVAGALGVAEDELVFTSGGTEANNLALFGGLAERPVTQALVTSRVEHASVGAAADALARTRPVHRVGVDVEGVLDLDALTAVLAAGPTALVSVQAAGNEVGTLTPMEGVRDALADAPHARPRLHTDAVQALGRVPLALHDWQVDLASFSAHKVGGPIGVGVLWVRAGVALQPLFFGGGQERELRPGTENAPAIAAAALAIEMAVSEQAAYRVRTGELARYLWEAIAREVPGASLNGPPLDAQERLPNTLSVSLPDTDGKVLVMRLDLVGLEVSAGSACASGSLEPSHVLRAMGRDEDAARAALRLSLGWNSTRADCEHAVDILRKVASVSHAT